MDSLIEVTALGQAGYRFRFGQSIVYIDPYLSDSVQRSIGDGARRMVPAPLRASEIRDASLILITHSHLDHCDPETLRPIADASPAAQFIAPADCHPILAAAGIGSNRLLPMPIQPQECLPDLVVQAVPAAHPTLELDASGLPRCVGYLLRFGGRLLLHAGDTLACDELIGACQAAGPADWAFLPVNEANFFKTRANIIGNMSPREAFWLADEIGARCVIPTHWDLFPNNCVPIEEIQLVFRLCSRGHILSILPCGKTVRLHPLPTE